nr:hypothetical protein [Stenotrophomonas maltophilia]
MSKYDAAEDRVKDVGRAAGHQVQLRRPAVDHAMVVKGGLQAYVVDTVWPHVPYRVTQSDGLFNQRRWVQVHPRAQAQHHASLHVPMEHDRKGRRFIVEDLTELPISDEHLPPSGKPIKGNPQAAALHRSPNFRRFISHKNS